MFTRTTPRPLSLGDFFGLEFSSVSKRILKRTPKTGSVFAFTNAGSATQYPNATYSFKKFVTSTLVGSTLDAVIILVDANGNYVDVSNVDRVTVQ